MTSAVDTTNPVTLGSLPWPDLDDLDRNLIAALQEDGRASLAGLAKTVGESVGAARQRYERLRQRGMICAVAVVDPAALGRHVIAHLEIVVDRGIRTVAEGLRGYPEVAWMAVGLDYQTIRLQISVGSNADLVSFLNQRVRALPEVREISSSILLRSWSPVFRFGGGAPPLDQGPAFDTLWHGNDPAGRAVDEVDVVLLGCLERDARATITSMADRVGLSVPATRQRVVRFLRDGTLRIRTRPDPTVKGVIAAGLVMTLHGDSTQVAECVAAMPNVSYVLETTGPAVLRAELLCAREEQITEAHGRAGDIPGVSHVRVVRHGAIAVHTGHW